ncbi:unnamed protein product [Vicia faba]|uniref:Uncharacterized protein n=1 Tax=Vicia faba TaxID=3906 RepID=A0AAV0ZCB7_VICFA|nr:unnamed protein product [Vicia faba]
MYNIQSSNAMCIFSSSMNMLGHQPPTSHHESAFNATTTAKPRLTVAPYTDVTLCTHKASAGRTTAADLRSTTKITDIHSRCSACDSMRPLCCTKPKTSNNHAESDRLLKPRNSVTDPTASTANPILTASHTSDHSSPHRFSKPRHLEQIRHR